MRLAITLICIVIALPCMAADYVAEIVTAKQLVGFGYEPVLNTDYHTACGEGYSFEDVTVQDGIRDPNLMVAKIICDNATLDAMVAAGYIELWREKVQTTEVPR